MRVDLGVVGFKFLNNIYIYMVAMWEVSGSITCRVDTKTIAVVRNFLNMSVSPGCQKTAVSYS